jgi:hypothetical protein
LTIATARNSIGAVNAFFSGVAYFLIDGLGRRTLLLSSLVIMLPFLLLEGHLLDNHNETGALIVILIYFAAYSPGAGVSTYHECTFGQRSLNVMQQVIPWMYSSEIFPLIHREAGMSLGCAVTFAFAGALAMAVPQYARKIDDQHLTLLGAIAAFDAAAVVLVWVYMRSPEDPISLEDMTVSFDLQPSGCLLVPSASRK